MEPALQERALGGVAGEGERAGWLVGRFSLISMPQLGIAKLLIAEQIGSAATKGEGRQKRALRLPGGRAADRPGRQRDRRRLVAR